MRIEDVMTQPAVTCLVSDTLNTAAQLMWDHDCGAIPVTDADGRLVGIVTDRDVCMATYTKGLPPSSIAVYDAMAKQVYSVHAGDDLEQAERLMTERQIRRLPVVDKQNRPIGMFSVSDFARHAATSRKRDSLDRELTQTLASICTPRSRIVLSSKSARPQASARRGELS
jgi:CBS domain-containing protein